jgi:hypothetical protein
MLSCFGNIVSQVEENFNVPLMGVDKAVLEKVVDFLKLYHNDPMRKIEKVRHGTSKRGGEVQGVRGTDLCLCLLCVLCVAVEQGQARGPRTATGISSHRHR